MKHLTDIETSNRAAVLREYADAIHDKNTALALRILRANPDCFTPDDEYRLNRMIAGHDN